MPQVQFDPYDTGVVNSSVKFEPYEPFRFESQANPPEQEKGWLQKWDENIINQPLLDYATNWEGERLVDPKKWSEYIDPPESRTEDMWKIPGTDLPIRSFVAGAVEGAGDVVRGLTTPLNLATWGAGATANRALKTATTLPGLASAYTTAPKIAKAATRVTQALSVPVIGTGAAHTYEGARTGDWGKAAFGAAEMAGGAAGLHSYPAPDWAAAIETPGKTLGDISPAPPPRPPRVEYPDYEPGSAMPIEPPEVPMTYRPGSTMPEPVDFTPTQDVRSSTVPPDQPIPPPTQQYPTIGDFEVNVFKKTPTVAETENLRQQGWISAGVTKDGAPFMIRKTNAEPTTELPTKEPTTPPGAGDIVTFHENDVIPIPESKTSPAIIARLKQQGIELVGKDDKGNNLFQRSQEEGPSFEVTDPELFKQRQWELQRELLGGEETGRVAPFTPETTPSWNQRWEPEAPSGVPETPIDQGKLQEFADGIRAQTESRRSYTPDEIRQIEDPRDLQAAEKHWQDYEDEVYAIARQRTQAPPKEVIDNLNAARVQLQIAKDRINKTGDYAPLTPEWRDMLTRANRLVDQAEGKVPLTTGLDPRMAQRIESVGSRDWDFTRKTSQQDPSVPFDLRQHNMLERISEATPDDTIQGTMMDAPITEEPSFARVKGGGLVIDADIARATGNITKDYTGPLSAIMSREGMQNAMDAADVLGDGGVVKIRIRNADNSPTKTPTIEIYDNGGGLDETALSEKLVRLFASGKENAAGATGGKGIGSASYIAGGKHFEIDTVAVDSIDGQKYRIVAGGTPEQFGDPVRGSDWNKELVDPSTPTGTTITVQLKKGQEAVNARDMMDNVIKHSRDRPSTVVFDRFGHSSMGEHVSEFKDHQSEYAGAAKFKSSADDKVVSDFISHDTNVTIQVPKFDPDVVQTGIDVHYLNNGMYQFSDRISVGEKNIKGVPDHVIVNLKPLVDEMHDNYPFTNTRQHINSELQSKIDERIKTDIAKPAVSKQKNRTQELYDQLATTQVTGGIRKTSVFDPGNRLTPDELNTFTSHPTTQALLQHFDAALDEILQAVGRDKWSERLEGVGLVLDPGMHGVHIPNPTTGKSTIMVNPFARIEMGSTPKATAWDNTMTNLHEVAHIGNEAGGQVVIDPASFSDPRAGEFFKSYLEQVVAHGDTGIFQNTGHGMGFVHRLGEAFTKYGAENAFRSADRLESILTGGNKSGGYSPEVQKLLHLYQESRGRAPVTEDLLSPTGVKQANRGSSGKGNIPSTPKANGNGANTPVPPKGREKPSIVREAYNLSRGLTTTMDLSAPLRQGLPLITSKEWWKSWKQMIGSLRDEGAFQKTLSDLKNREIFQSRIDTRTGKVIKSYAEQAGLKISELSSDIGKREESVASNWVENGRFLGGENPIQRGYEGTVGRAARASNRAYTAFLNQLRADTFENLIKDAKRIYEADVKTGKKDARDPATDIAFAKEIADFVNTATGRGPLRTEGFTIKQNAQGQYRPGLKTYSVEQNARLLTDLLFSPRLMASRVRMMNPLTYSMASPFVRQQYMKAALSTSAAWLGVAGLAWGAGANVSWDTNSADFAKIRIGDTRLDLGSGFQQYVVPISRFLSGHTTSSASGTDFELGAGYQAQTRGDIAHRFAANKLHPVAKFAHDLLFASQHVPFNMLDRVAQMFVPLIIQDVYELAKKDPSLIPFILPPVASGAGTQTYDKGESGGRLVPESMDWKFQGGELPGYDQIFGEEDGY